jgi:PmbA protein
MNQEMRDLVKWVTQTAQDSGASQSSAQLTRSREVNIRYRENKPEIVKEASKQGLILEVYCKGKYSVQSTPDMRKPALGEFIKNQIRNTAYLEEDPYRILPDPLYYAGRTSVDLKKTDPDHDSLSIQQRHQKVREIEEACLARGNDSFLSVQAEMKDTYGESIAITSNGFEGEDEGTAYTAYAEITVGDEGNRKPNGYFGGSARRLADLPDPLEMADRAARDALDQVGARKIPTERLPVIIQNNSASRIFSGFMSAMLGSNLQQKRSFLLDKKGLKVGSELFSVVDDPLLLKGLASRMFDGDGFPGKKRIMIHNGILREYYVDWYYSRKMGREPSTGGPSNLVIPKGNRSVGDIMNELGRGLLITSFIGGNSNFTTGDFSIGIIGMLFDRGEFVQPVSEMNIADNHLQFWHKLIETADDPWKYGSALFPSMVFDNILVAGT